MLLCLGAECLKSRTLRCDKLLVSIFVYAPCRYSSGRLKRKNDNIFKTLNRENKSLFGKLLETKSERRKVVSKSLSEVKSNTKIPGNQQGRSSEIHWIERLGSCKPIHATNTHINLRCVTTDNLSPNFSKKSFKPEILMRIADAGGKCSHNDSAEPVNCKSTEKESAFLAGVTEENVVKVPALQLPEIIIRNIPHFPLQNDKKRLSEDSFLGNVLNLSYDEVDKESHLYPSVSKILNATMSEGSRVALFRWRQKMIAELGNEEFLKYYKGLLAKGSLFHATVQRLLAGLPEEQLQLDPAVEGCWRSLSSVMPDIGGVYALESRVVHSRLKYRGVIDCVAEYQNKPVLIEWKKSDTQKPEIEKTYDAPMQLVAYLGAMNYDERYTFQVKGGLVVVAYSDGSPAHVFPLNTADCNKYWRMWLARVQQYWLLPVDSRSSSERNAN